jgi:hypothetical protein
MYFRSWTPAGVPYLENTPGFIDEQTVFLKMHFYRWDGGTKTRMASVPAAANDWFATDVHEQNKPHSTQAWVYLQNGSGTVDNWYVDYNQGYDWSHPYSVEFEIWWLQFSTQDLYGPITAYPKHRGITGGLQDYCLGYNYVPFISVDWGSLFRPVANPGLIY